MEKEIEQDGETITVYEYEEAKIYKEDWSLYQEVDQQRADIDYLLLIAE